MDYTPRDIARMIDHALLKPTMTRDDLEEGLRVALEHEVASVCIMPFYLKRSAEVLAGSTIAPSTVIGFPHGGQTTDTKLAESRRALADGGRELDMVINISAARSGDWDYVAAEISAITAMAHDQGAKVKVIFENCYLDEAQKLRLCDLCTEAQADWVKTSTGYGTGGATVADVQLMASRTGPHVQVKAAGGIRDLDALLALRQAGATRIGLSATTAILDECHQRLGA